MSQFRLLQVCTPEQDHPSEGASGPAKHKGKKYVVLRNTRGVLAVYRVRNDRMLKRLKRWPDALEQY